MAKFPNVPPRITLPITGTDFAGRPVYIDEDGCVDMPEATPYPDGRPFGYLIHDLEDDRFPVATGPDGLPYSPNGMAGDPEPTGPEGLTTRAERAGWAREGKENRS